MKPKLLDRVVDVLLLILGAVLYELGDALMKVGAMIGAGSGG